MILYYIISYDSMTLAMESLSIAGELLAPDSENAVFWIPGRSPSNGLRSPKSSLQSC